MRFSGGLAASLAVVWGLASACTPGSATYLDRVRPLAAEKVHPKVAELVPLLTKPEGRTPDDLVRTWREYVEGDDQPLRQETVTTFVYYDFSGGLKQVFLEASFASDRPEALVRVAGTHLFYRVYDIPKVDKLRYRFTDGKKPLADPLRRDVAPGPDLWHEPLDPALPTVEKISGVADAGLDGQDLTVVLPPGYRRNLGWTYPLLMVVGQDGDQWTAVLLNQMRTRAMLPVVAVGLPNRPNGWTAADLKPLLEDRIVPWVRSHYRVSPLPSDLTLTGWDQASAAVKDVASARPDFWNKTWHVDNGWSAVAPLLLRTLYPVVNP